MIGDKKLEAAADKLYSIGLYHGWWGKDPAPSWRGLDPIGRDEFLDVVAEVVDAYNGRAAPAHPEVGNQDVVPRGPSREPT